MMTEHPSNLFDQTLHIQDLCKSYHQEPVLDHFSMTLSYGHRYCLMAPSGTGKTTLLDIIAGRGIPDRGSITYNPSIKSAMLPQTLPAPPAPGHTPLFAR